MLVQLPEHRPGISDKSDIDGVDLAISRIDVLTCIQACGRNAKVKSGFLSCSPPRRRGPNRESKSASRISVRNTRSPDPVIPAAMIVGENAPRRETRRQAAERFWIRSSSAASDTAPFRDIAGDRRRQARLATVTDSGAAPVCRPPGVVASGCLGA
jgi:hypothetical protein